MTREDIETSSASIDAKGRPSRPARSRIANPGPLGLFSFGSTTLILSLYNISTRGIAHHNVVVGMAIFCGGLAQFLAGMWEFPKGNTFGATAFTSYGVFWLSFATLFIPGLSVKAAYPVQSEFESAVGIYLITWCIITFFFCIASVGKSVAFIMLFFILGVTFASLAGGALVPSVGATKAGGVLGVVCALIAYYIGLSDLLAAEEHPPFPLPLGVLYPKRD